MATTTTTQARQSAGQRALERAQRRGARARRAQQVRRSTAQGAGSARLEQSARPIITEEKQAEVRERSRVERGRRLFEEHAGELRHDHGVWWIPSCSGEGVYGVRLGPVEVCECADFEYRAGRCKHIVCASLAQAKSRVCACCGHRVLGRFLSEVEEDDELLSWFPGDVLCAECIRAGYWV